MLQSDLLARVKPRRLTRVEYDRMVQLGFFGDERLELLHGMVIAMSPIGPPHREVVDLLTEALVLALHGRARVSTQNPFVASDDSEPEPDLAVVPLGTYRTDHPHRAFLVIEVADSSLDADRDVKGPLYASSGVPEYWLVNLVDEVVEVYTDPVGGRYRSARAASIGETLHPAAFPDVAVAVAPLFR